MGRRCAADRLSVDPELEPRPELVNPALEWLGSLDEQSFERMFNGSPVRRAGFRGLQRNVAIAMGNSGLAQFAPSSKSGPQAAMRACARPQDGRWAGCAK